MRRTLGMCVALFAASLVLPAQNRERVSDLAWLAGVWHANVAGGIAEETCTQPAGGSMACMLRIISAGNVVWLEFTVIRETATGIVIDTRFFNPDSQPAQPISAELELKGAENHEWHFENQAGTQPKTETISFTGPDTWANHVEFIDAKGNKTSLDASWNRAH
jgi:uncharacterized protein DUF6265